MSSVPLGFTVSVSGMRTQNGPGRALAVFSRDQNPWRSESVNSGCISMWRSTFTRSFIFRDCQTATDIEMLSVLQNVSEWCVSSLLSLMCEVNGFIFVRTVQRTASRWHGSNVPAFDVRFFLTYVWLIYDPVSSKTSCFKNRIRECVKLDSLFRYCAQQTGGYCMVVVCSKQGAWLSRDNACVVTDPCHADPVGWFQQSVILWNKSRDRGVRESKSCTFHWRSGNLKPTWNPWIHTDLFYFSTHLKVWNRSRPVDNSSVTHSLPLQLAVTRTKGMHLLKTTFPQTQSRNAGFRKQILHL